MGVGRMEQKTGLRSRKFNVCIKAVPPQTSFLKWYETPSTSVWTIIRK